MLCCTVEPSFCAQHVQRLVYSFVGTNQCNERTNTIQTKSCSQIFHHILPSMIRNTAWSLVLFTDRQSHYYDVMWDQGNKQKQNDTASEWAPVAKCVDELKRIKRTIEFSVFSIRLVVEEEVCTYEWPIFELFYFLASSSEQRQCHSNLVIFFGIAFI